jgi:dTDP-4-amino-4,6-dideoxygalactose transaminase
VIEDDAHAPGAELEGRALGAWGSIGCFSFFSNKNLSTGEGGMVVTDQDDLAEKVHLLRSHGMTSLTWDRHRGHAHTYDVVDLGYNYRIDEIRAALGRVQLNKLDANNTRRKEITESYWNRLSETDLTLPFRSSRGGPAYHIFPVLLPPDMDRLKFIDGVKAAGVQTSIHYPPIHHFTYYRRRYPGVALPQTEEAAGREVTLPLYPGMDDAALETVITAVCSSLDALR